MVLSPSQVFAAVLSACSCACSLAQSTSEAWDRSVLGAWAAEPDCAPSTGMCDACGLGATVVEMADDGTTAVRTYNIGSGNKPAPWGPNATIETASVTKLFTAVLALVLDGEGNVSVNTMLKDVLPCEWGAAAYPDVGTIALHEIITHTSGLPPQPPNCGKPVGGNPFYGFTEEMLCTSLLTLNGLPTRGRYSYSNYAYGTLGYALALATGAESYEALIRERVLMPLGMTNTGVTYDDAGWGTAAEGCDRGMHRSNRTIRTGKYGVLQGNGALRSTLNDMGKFLGAMLLIDTGSEGEGAVRKGMPLHTAFERALVDDASACSCVSGWCEGILCDLPNPYAMRITMGGVEGYSSGGVAGWKKSGDTGGYSLRVAWSGAKRRAAFAVDTCGGCGERGASGSAAQRATLLLADGPPAPANQGAALAGTAGRAAVRFAGETLSHIYPSVAAVELALRAQANGTATVAVASSDGAGGTAGATPGGAGTWVVDAPVLSGAGYQAGADPLAMLPQRRAVVVAADGKSATLQDMGVDIHLSLKRPSGQANDERSVAIGSAENKGRSLFAASQAMPQSCAWLSLFGAGFLGLLATRPAS
eukprot:CAMPEP_0179034516 /NCGR_PEP_ID=MMETSP0796-20121207/12649_1 /TAXON_ID=73915 /ORGANISM="Pyrodinium bahamense, Strain pbaha01" /LENGTH=589 /DNA_ID=CAMNT_0020730787 /DNA_START=60 /DNA_END=1829 /DNA_ORIENTATION=-